MNSNAYEGVSIGRSAAYRAAYQIPRYRFYDDPPLDETDAEYMRTSELIIFLISAVFLELYIYTFAEPKI